MNLHAQKSLLFLKWITISTLLLGMFLHMSRFVFGTEALLTKLLTPAFEVFFTIPLTIGCVIQLTLIRKINFRTGLEKIVYYFCSFQFVVSVPVHLIAAVAGSSTYVNAFPRGYSVVTTILWCYFIYVFVNLRLKEKSMTTIITHTRRTHAAWFI
jgi:hypothetical protein